MADEMKKKVFDLSGPLNSDWVRAGRLLDPTGKTPEQIKADKAEYDRMEKAETDGTGPKWTKASDVAASMRAMGIK